LKFHFPKKINTTACVSEDEPLFYHFDPKQVIHHHWTKLRKMWADLRRLYGLAHSNFTQFGQYDQFREYCKGNGDVLYLWTCLNDKPGLIDHVKSGFFQIDTYDSLEHDFDSDDQSSVMEIGKEKLNDELILEQLGNDKHLDIPIQHSETPNTVTPKSSKKRKLKQSNKDDVKQSDVKVISEGIKLIANSLNNEYDSTLKS